MNKVELCQLWDKSDVQTGTGMNEIPKVLLSIIPQQLSSKYHSDLYSIMSYLIICIQSYTYNIYIYIYIFDITVYNNN